MLIAFLFYGLRRSFNDLTYIVCPAVFVLYSHRFSRFYALGLFNIFVTPVS